MSKTSFGTQNTVKIYGENSSGGEEEIKVLGGAAYVTLNVSAATVSYRTAYCDAGAGLGVKPSEDLSATPAANDIIVWTFASGSPGKRKVSLFASKDSVAGNTHIGWWVAINAGSAVAASTLLQEALGSNASNKVAEYASGATVDGDTDKASLIVPFFTKLVFTFDADITDMYLVPISQATTTVGGSVLTAVLS